MGLAKSSLLPKDVIFVRVFGSLASGDLGHSLHMFMADSLKLALEGCPVYLFLFLGLASSGLEDGISSWKHAVGWLQGKVSCPSRERRMKKWEREEWVPFSFGGSKVLGQLGQRSVLIFLKNQHRVFPYEFQQRYGATQTNKLETRPGFVCARFTC